MSATVNGHLRQSEIDALIGLGPEVLGRPGIATYDFATPPRIGGAREKALRVALDRYADTLRDLLTSRLRGTVEVALRGIEQSAPRELALSLGEPAATWAFPLGEDGQGHGWLDLGGAMALRWVDRLLGGVGEDAGAPRPLTALEQRVMRGLVQLALEPLRAVWPVPLPIGTTPAAFESDPLLLPGAASGTPMVVFAIEVRCEGSAGMVTLALPLPFAGTRPAPEAGEETAEASADSPAVVAGTLRRARVTLSARMPRTRLSARAIVALRAGSVIPLAQEPSEPVVVYVNGRPRFLALVGQVRGRLALRIVQTVDESPAHRGGGSREE